MNSLSKKFYFEVNNIVHLINLGDKDVLSRITEEFQPALAHLVFCITNEHYLAEVVAHETMCEFKKIAKKKKYTQNYFTNLCNIAKRRTIEKHFPGGDMELYEWLDQQFILAGVKTELCRTLGGADWKLWPKFNQRPGGDNNFLNTSQE